MSSDFPNFQLLQQQNEVKKTKLRKYDIVSSLLLAMLESGQRQKCC